MFLSLVSTVMIPWLSVKIKNVLLQTLQFEVHFFRSSLNGRFWKFLPLDLSRGALFNLVIVRRKERKERKYPVLTVRENSLPLLYVEPLLRDLRLPPRCE
jgi:hypothetical protein